MASSSPRPSASPGPLPVPIPDDDDAQAQAPSLPLTMSASIVLTSLPQDASTALAHAGLMAEPTGKVTVRFKAVGSAPILKQQVYKISAAQRFETVVKFLRGKLKCGPRESVFCYVNSVFAPGLDEVVGNLFKCFKSDDQLIIAYSMNPAFG